MATTKRYITTIETTWEVTGDVHSTMINERIQKALDILMMTSGETNFATFGSGSQLDVTTVEVPYLLDQSNK